MSNPWIGVWSKAYATVYHLCCVVVCRRKDPDKKYDTVHQDDYLTDMEGGQLKPSKPTLEAKQFDPTPYPTESRLSQAHTASRLAQHTSRSANTAAEPVLPSQLAAEAEAAMPVQQVQTILPTNRVVTDESSEEYEEEESDSDSDDGDGGVPNLLAAPTHAAPNIILSKTTPRVIEESASSASMSSLSIGANRMQERRQKREQLLQQLQVRPAAFLNCVCVGVLKLITASMSVL